ncbi:Alpha/Beta hydrolase protein [Cladorrhinum sp. PSN332]|nr:Alpha/Beta hydrolase protein [Cladorrhinum sp. PSN332]
MAVTGAPPVPQDVKDSYRGPFGATLNWNPSDDDTYRKISLDFQVPLSYRGLEGGRITVHAELLWDFKDNDATRNVTWQEACVNRKWLVFLCGGPGDRNPYDRSARFNELMLKRGYCILFPDYRGTGQSTPVTAQSLQDRFPVEAKTTTAGLVDYLSLFRQDNIVRDLEAMRQAIEETELPMDISIKFTLHGQSFGGWVALTYLSFLPRSLDEVYLTAGLAPITKTPEEIYRRLFGRLVTANERYYEIYPADVNRVKEIFRTLDDRGENYRVPDGSQRILNARMFLTLGRQLIGGTPGFNKVHHFVVSLHNHLRAQMEADNEDTGIPESLLLQFGDIEGFKLYSRPLYGMLHEAIYCAWPGVQSNWAAFRVGRTIAGYNWLDADFDINDAPEKLYFSGEMIYHFMMDNLRSDLLRQAAEGLAQKNDWPFLYDSAVLGRSQVGLRALVFPEDLAVDFDSGNDTLDAVGASTAIPADESWEHGSLRTRTDDVIQMLYENRGANWRQPAYGG